MSMNNFLSHDEPLLPDLALSPDALTGGTEVLSKSDPAISHMLWSMYGQPETSFFNLPLLYRLRQRSYHQIMLDGPFDTGRLVKDHRQHIFRSGVSLSKESQPSVESLLLCLGQGVFVIYDACKLTVFAPTPQTAAKAAADFGQYVTGGAQDKPAFHLVSLTPTGPCAEPVELDGCPPADTAALALHYGADFAAWEQQWLARLAQRHSGVTLFYGPPGVGKTSYLKMLMARFIDRFAFYYLPLSSFELLTEPQFVAFWLSENKSHAGKTKLAIIEDAENLLLPRDEGSWAQVSNLLNIGDGFLGEHLKLHVIATTNAPVRRLDAAVLRPGRLMGSREFRRLTQAEALCLAEAKGLTLRGDSDSWSLAEIYNGQPETFATETNIGFSRCE